MFFEWWMIGVLGVFWVASVLSYGHVSFRSGALSLFASLEESGYVKVAENGDIIGLCNQNQGNFDIPKDRDLDEDDMI